jgi:hypothetical protein
MARVSATTISAAAILVLCLWNVARSLQQYFHWPVPTGDEFSILDDRLSRTREVLASIPDRHIEYRVEDADESYDLGNQYRLQYLLAPIVLWRMPTDNRYVLVEFWRTRNVRSLPDLTLLGDLGNGFGLYRRP